MNEEVTSKFFGRILVVDDTTANLQLLTKILTEQGYTVYPASDGVLALRFVESTLPDLILLDIKMPGMDGYEVCRRLKADERTRSLPIIFISALENECDKVKGFQAGAVDYITKPFQPEEVLARVKIHLRLQKLTVRLEQEVHVRTEELATTNQRLQQELAERQRAEALLRESEERYRLVFENSPVSIWEEDFSGVKTLFDDLKKQGVTDLEPYLDQHPETLQHCAESVKIVDVNLAAFSLHEAADKEELLAGLVNTFTPESFDTFRREMICLWNGGTKMTRDAVVKTLTGDLRNVTVYFSVCPGYEETFAKVLVSLIDITQRKQVEDVLKNTARRLREAQHLAHIGNWELDLTANALTWSDEIYRIFEIDPEEFGATYEAFLNAIHPDDREAVNSAYTHSLQTKTPFAFEHRLLFSDGRVKYVYEQCETCYEDDTPICSKGAIQDITERKKLEAQLRQSQKMEAVGQLAGGVAHDFNNMLGVILGYADMVLDRIDPNDPLREYLMQIKRAGQRSTEITRQLLAFARKQTIKPEILNLNKTIEGMLKLLRRLIGEDNDLVWLPYEDLWPVEIDPSQIDQILANLCVNAKDAITGVGKITIETQNVDCDDVSCAEPHGVSPGAYVLLTVSDNGKGMDKPTLNKIFDPFFTTKEMGKGTGLGLSTVYGIVKQNGGFINVYSEPGYGSTFKMYLHRHAVETEQIGEESPAAQIVQGSETILLVEDDTVFLDLVKGMLDECGYTVLTSSTPEKAIQLAAENSGKIKLLLTDVVMPEMTGRDLEKNLRLRYPEIKCLFMSGYTANVIAHQGVLDEDVNFIQKPFSKQELAAKVREALDSK